MQRTHLLVLSLLAPVLGCRSGSATTAPTTPPPHGGALFAIPGDRGYVEVLSKLDPARPRTGRGNNQVVVYFLGPDKATALSPAPTDATAILNLGGSNKVAGLKPDPRTGDAFATDFGQYGGNETSGEISARVGGEMVKIPFELR